MSHTVEDALKLVISEKRQQDRAAGTLEMYEQKAQALLRGLGSGKLLESLTADDIDAYIAQRLAAGISHHTVHKDLVVLEQALRTARRRKWFNEDPKVVMPVKFGPQYEPRKEFLPEDRWDEMLAGFDPGHAAHLAFMLATGANLGEAARARKEHVDLAKGIVFIDGTKRTTRKRWVPVTALNKPLLERVLRDADGSDGLLFRPWANIWRDLGRRCTQMGIPHLSSNDLRRTYGSVLVQRGVPMEIVAKLMGHSSTAMVYKVYGQLRPEHLKNIVDQYVTGV